MFHLEDRSPKVGIRHVFLHANPLKEGYVGKVDEDVSLDYDMRHIHSWPDGERRPEPCLARDPKNPKHFKVFKTDEERQRARFDLVAQDTPSVYNYWTEYTKAMDNSRSE